MGGKQLPTQMFNFTMKNFIKTHIKDILIYLAFVVISAMFLMSLKQCNDNKQRYENNIEALTDSVNYFKSKSDMLVAEKKVFELENINELKKLNSSLYNEVNDLKNLVKKKNITNATQFSGVITNELHDTTYIVEYDTITRGFSHDFAFNDEWRELEGNVNYFNDSLSMGITKDITRFDYTVVTDKDNKVYIKSKNPYVQFDEFTGFTIPNKTNKQKHFGIGPEIGMGINTKGEFTPYIGIGAHWSLWKF